jgi:hypothetical protein
LILSEKARWSIKDMKAPDEKPETVMVSGSPPNGGRRWYLSIQYDYFGKHWNKWPIPSGQCPNIIPIWSVSFIKQICLLIWNKYKLRD